MAGQKERSGAGFAQSFRYDTILCEAIIFFLPSLPSSFPPSLPPFFLPSFPPSMRRDWGKTLQVIALLLHLHRSDPTSAPHLIVLPLSVLDSWEQELRAVAPQACVHVHRGEQNARKLAFRRAIYAQAAHFRCASRPCKAPGRAESTPGEPASPFPPPLPLLLVLTTYDILLRDFALLRLGPRAPLPSWHYLIVDEGHRLKNARSKLLHQLARLPTARRLLVTGTPLQNDLKELFTLLAFLQPTVFHHASSLQEWFERACGTEGWGASALDSGLPRQPHTEASHGGTPGGFTGAGRAMREKELRQVVLSKEEESLVLCQLHSVLRPFLLRRTKSQSPVSPSPETRAASRLPPLRLATSALPPIGRSVPCPFPRPHLPPSPVLRPSSHHLQPPQPAPQGL